MNILFLSYWFPFPANNGSKIRIKNLLSWLGQHHAVTLLSFADQTDLSPESPEVHSVCLKARVIPRREFNPNSRHARFAIIKPKPRSIVDTFSPEMAQAITETINRQKYDLIIASQIQMAAYYQYFQGVPALFEELEIGLFHDRAFSSDGSARFRHAMTWFKLRMYLMSVLNSFYGCTVTSEQERRKVLRNFPAYKKPIEVIPNGLQMDEYRDIKVDKKNNTLIFSGSFKYHANYDAMVWFIGEIFPSILSKIPDTQLIITGDHGNQHLPSWKNVTLAGHVDDIKSLIGSCTVSIAPLLSGGGTRLKILEAMALETPVVATSKGGEGLDVIDGKHLLLADSPSKFAECVIRLLNDDDLRLRLVQNASQLVYESYNWKNVLSNYSRLMYSIVE